MKKEKKESIVSLGNIEKKPHGNAKELDWRAFDALLRSDPTKEFCCHYFEVSTTHIDNKIYDKFGLTFTEYKRLKLEDRVSSIKNAMMEKAESGDVGAGKYVLSNLSDWVEKRELSIEDLGDKELLNETLKLLENMKNGKA